MDTYAIVRALLAPRSPRSVGTVILRKARKFACTDSSCQRPECRAWWVMLRSCPEPESIGNAPETHIFR
jgi:hypothetical protein